MPDSGALDPRSTPPGEAASGSAGTGQTSPGLGITDAMALVVLFIGIWTLPGILSAMLRALGGRGLPASMQLLVGQLVAGAVLIPIGLRWSGQRLREACPAPPFSARLLPGILLGSIGLAIVLGELASWVPGAGAWRDSMQRLITATGMAPLIFTGWVIAPVMEELLCRGVMLRGLVVRHTAAAAILTTAILWALMHLNPYQGVMALPLGLMYGWLSLRTRSVLPSMVSHAMVNSAGGLVVLPALLALGYKFQQVRALAHMPVVILVPGAVAAVVGCGLVWWQLRAGTLEGDDVRTAPPVPAGSGRLHMTVAVLATLCLIVVAVAARALPGETGLRLRTATTLRKFAGCYQLQLPGDVAARLFPGATSPLDVRFTRRPYDRVRRDKFMVELLAGTDPPPVYWIPRNGGDVTVTDAKTAVVLTLHPRGQTLSGRARTYDAATQAARNAGTVTARRVACPGSVPGRP